MKNFLFIAATILLDAIGGGFDRCSSKHYDDIYLNVSTNTVELDDQGGARATFGVSSNSHWRISNGDRWLEVSPNEGKNVAQITVTAITPNDSPTNRSSSVRIFCEGINIEVKVVQKGKEEQ